MIYHGNHPYIISRTNYQPYQVQFDKELTSNCEVFDDLITVNQATAENTFNFAYGGVGLENITISDTTIKIANNTATNSNNGAIFLENCKNVTLKNLTIVSDDKQKHGQGIHLIGCENVNIQNCRFVNRISCISTFFVNNLVISFCCFYKFNEAIDIDKPSQNICINHNLFSKGSKNSNEAIDCNACKDVLIWTNKFVDCGRVLFFNGKKGITQTYQEWMNLNWESSEKPKELKFIKGEKLTFIYNIIDNCGCNDQNSLIILGNKFGRGEPTSDLKLFYNKITNSGQIITQDVVNCLIE